MPKGQGVKDASAKMELVDTAEAGKKIGESCVKLILSSLLQPGNSLDLVSSSGLTDNVDR
jgi:hypothetical protein